MSQMPKEERRNSSSKRWSFGAVELAKEDIAPRPGHKSSKELWDQVRLNLQGLSLTARDTEPDDAAAAGYEPRHQLSRQASQDPSLDRESFEASDDSLSDTSHQGSPFPHQRQKQR